MLRIFIFLSLVLLLGFAFAWFADRPGDVMLVWQGNQYQTSLMVVVVGIAVLVAVTMFVWWIARTILDSPKIMQRFWSSRKKDRGYRALSMGLIAANSGDASAARRFTKESVKLLGHEPLVDLLDAQAALLEGNRDEARKRFEEMLGEDETKLVALRGLYLEAERQKAGEAARHYAEEAHKAAPNLPWAANAKLRYASQDGDWTSALNTLEASRVAGLVDKETAKRQKAVLLTAKAMQDEPADPSGAAKAAREAHKLAPDLVAAAIIGAKALSRNNDIGRAAGMLEAVWKKTPHPEIAQSYIHLRMGDAALDRMKRARKLAGLKPNHNEGNYAIAEAAIEAQDWQAAREALAPLLAGSPSERTCLIMADIEEGEFGDKGRMRGWLARAVRAPRDAAWTADGFVSEKWLPISPVTGRIDAFEWKVPVEQLGGPDAQVYDAEGLEALVRKPVVTADEEEAEPGIAEKLTAAIGLSGDTQDAEIIEEEVDPTKAETDVAAADDQTVKPDGAEAEKVIDVEVAESKDNASKDDTAPEKPKDLETSESPKNRDGNIFALDRRPDDPGIGDDDEPKPKKFGIF